MKTFVSKESSHEKYIMAKQLGCFTSCFTLCLLLAPATWAKPHFKVHIMQPLSGHTRAVEDSSPGELVLC